MIFPGSMEKPLNQFFNETAVFLYTFKNIKEIDHASVKRVVVVDTQIRSRVPQVQDLLDLPGVEVEVWDHHPTPYSGEKNKVINADVTHIGTTGSTCTLICQALQERGITPACQEATFLALGIYGDTGASYLHVHQAGRFLRGHGCASTAWICLFIADLVQTGHDQRPHQGSQRAARLRHRARNRPLQRGPCQATLTAFHVRFPLYSPPRNSWRWNPATSCSPSPTWRKRYRSWPAAAWTPWTSARSARRSGAGGTVSRRPLRSRASPSPNSRTPSSNSCTCR